MATSAALSMSRSPLSHSSGTRGCTSKVESDRLARPPRPEAPIIAQKSEFCPEVESREVPAFATDGFVAGGTVFLARDMAVQPDDKVIVIGHGGGRYGPDFAVTRFNADATLDV